MAYADQEMSGNRMIAIIIVALIHIGIGYVLITGLAYSAVEKVMERVTTVDIEEPEEPEPEEEPPPPEEMPETVPPPQYVPPVPIDLNQRPPDSPTSDTPPPPGPPPTRVPPPGPPPGRRQRLTVRVRWLPTGSRAGLAGSLRTIRRVPFGARFRATWASLSRWAPMAGFPVAA
ncbi:hypothetical protein [Erythrobacter sp. EC-HK427]|uniref:hypothetical protein n=1 Tax=Erythrobacter sp. EC-HK427 TaxID=2038396 RepID=UPI00125176CB|nr:hypothetical protein ERY430_41097 [Erythrobacter sp. EC-HK427]